MSADNSSRFRDSASYRTTVAPGAPELELLEPRLPAAAETALMHRVRSGDRLDLLAQRYFGDPLQYWRIVDANRRFDPDDLLEPGTLLRIPRTV
jgi:nucleoid-associated protein YgaU